MFDKIISVLALFVAAAFANGNDLLISTQLSTLGNLKVGQFLPNFAGVDLSLPGLELIDRDDLMNQVKDAGVPAHPVLVFFSTTCLPCRVGLFSLRDHADELTKNKVQVLLVALGDDRATVRRYLQEFNIPFHVLHDPEGKAAIRYGVMGKSGQMMDAKIPVTVVGDAKGFVTLFITNEGADYLSLVMATKSKKQGP